MLMERWTYVHLKLDWSIDTPDKSKRFCGHRFFDYHSMSDRMTFREKSCKLASALTSVRYRSCHRSLRISYVFIVIVAVYCFCHCLCWLHRFPWVSWCTERKQHYFWWLILVYFVQLKKRECKDSSIEQSVFVFNPHNVYSEDWKWGSTQWEASKDSQTLTVRPLSAPLPPERYGYGAGS